MQTPALERVVSNASGPNARKGAEVTTVKVILSTGQLLVTLRQEDTLATLRQYLSAHFAKAGGVGVTSAYELRSVHPARTYSEGQRTLKELGLVPNATLFVRELPANAK